MEQQTEVARSCGRTLASLHPDQVMSSALWFKLKECNTDLLWIIVLPASRLHFKRAEIICRLAELLTERREEILAANKTDMNLAINTGILLSRISIEYSCLDFFFSQS